MKSFSSLRWRTARLILQNTRNTFAREHPLSIFDAVFKFAAGTLAGPPEYFFHPLACTGAVVRKGALYELELVFPHAAAEQCEAFLQAVGRWLEEPFRNFALRHAGPVRERSLAVLLEEQGDLAEAEELCLDFLTPLSIKPLSQRELHAFGGAELFRLFANRLRRWYGEEAAAELEALRPAFEGARLLPWFWEYAQFRHRAKSASGEQFVCGMQGPLYVRGDIAKLLPLLLIGQELHLGPKKSSGRGAYRLSAGRPFMDERLADSAWYEAAFVQCSQDTDLPFFREGADKAEELERIREACASGSWQSGTAQAFLLEGGERATMLPPDDMLAQRAVFSMLAPAVNASLPKGILGWRSGRKGEACERLAQAMEGRAWLVRAGIRDFFGSVPHEKLMQSLHEFLPLADTAARHFLSEAVAMPAHCRGGEPLHGQGLLQGSPLAPLLADIFLHGVDCAMAGYSCLRFGRELFVPADSEEAARQALALLGEKLGSLGLGLDEESAVFRAGEFFDAEPGEVRGRRPLYVQQVGASVGVDGESVLVRNGQELLGRAPLHAVSEIYLLGAGSVSSRLVQKCGAEGIPLSFCSPAGWHYGTLAPASREWYGLIGAHAAQHAALSPAERTEAARTLVRAKVRGAETWLASRSEGRAVLLEAADRARVALEKAASPAEVMGVEGAFARAVFPLVNDLVKAEAFRAERRKPRERADRWNSLLDAGYSLLFTRLYVQIQAAGLDPYLGFLHSPKDRYASLAADMQELFRHRVDQLAVRLVNQGVLRAEHFGQNGGRWRLEKEGYAALVRRFEAFLDTRHAGDSLTMRQGMERQIRAVKRWACREIPLILREEPCRGTEERSREED